jgi:hypothetical protein
MMPNLGNQLTALPKVDMRLFQEEDSMKRKKAKGGERRIPVGGAISEIGNERRMSKPIYRMKKLQRQYNSLTNTSPVTLNSDNTHKDQRQTTSVHCMTGEANGDGDFRLI